MRHSPFKKLEISERERKERDETRRRGKEAGGIWTLQNI